MNLIKAVFYSPLLVVVIVVFLIGLTGGLDAKLIITISLTIYFIGLIFTIFVGVPTYLILNSLNIKNGFAYIAIGSISPVFLLWMAMFFGSKDYSFIFLIGAISSCFGAFCAYVFWLYAVYKVPVENLNIQLNKSN